MAYALELIDLRKNFGKTEIIRGANLAVNAGERIGIIGPNGAGKSTLFNFAQFSNYQYFSEAQRF